MYMTDISPAVPVSPPGLRHASPDGALQPCGAEPTERFKFLVCVDDTPQSRVALRFAALRAMHTDGRLALLHVVEPPEFQEWMTVADAMENERRAEAEALLHAMAGDVHAATGLIPELQIRNGSIGEEILNAIREDGDIHALVIGAAPPAMRRGRLISWLAGQLAGSLEIPLVVVPGNLTAKCIERLA